MMKEQVIITKVSIKKQGERKHFQIKLPKSAKFIVGIEYGGRLISKSAAMIIKPFPAESRTPFKRNQLIGELKLQSCEEANWFYATDVFSSDVNLSYGDFSNSGFKVNDFTHGNKRTEEIVKVDAESTIIQGWFLDAVGKTQKVDINYEVNVYVWINVEE
jgi:hypothetical protein